MGSRVLKGRMKVFETTVTSARFMYDFCTAASESRREIGIVPGLCTMSRVS
jgi:hypothetical protein